MVRAECDKYNYDFFLNYIFYSTITSMTVILSYNEVRPISKFHFLLLSRLRCNHKKSFKNDKMKEAVNTWLQSQAASFCDDDIQDLVPCKAKFLNNGDNHVNYSVIFLFYVSLKSFSKYIFHSFLLPCGTYFPGVFHITTTAYRRSHRY